jgi:protein-S-isoprenylcysteine O-methyltransferase Ste14
MSINENKEFEAINQKTGERNFIAETECQSKEEYHRVKKAKAKKQSIIHLIVTAVVLMVSVFGIVALELIGWINDIFCIVLLCLAGAVAMFKAGYFWHEIKN